MVRKVNLELILNLKNSHSLW